MNIFSMGEVIMRYFCLLVVLTLSGCSWTWEPFLPVISSDTCPPGRGPVGTNRDCR